MVIRIVRTMTCTVPMDPMVVRSGPIAVPTPARLWQVAQATPFGDLTNRSCPRWICTVGGTLSSLASIGTASARARPIERVVRIVFPSLGRRSNRVPRRKVIRISLRGLAACASTRDVLGFIAQNHGSPSADAPHFSGTVVFKSLRQLLASIHDERPIASHRFADWFAGDQQQTGRRCARVGDADSVPVVRENHQPLLALYRGLGPELRLAANHVSEGIERVRNRLREAGAWRQGQVQIQNWRPAFDGSADSQRFPGDYLYPNLSRCAFSLRNLGRLQLLVMRRGHL